MPPIKRPLEYAEAGADVLAVQQGLHRAGFQTNARNGSYGDKTVADMAAFQSKVGISASGKMGQKTLDKLWSRMSADQQAGYLSYVPQAPAIHRCLYYGDTGDDVQAVQRMLYRAGIGATNAQNGNYGQKTVNDMVTFQQGRSIQATGNMGQKTFTALWQFAYAAEQEQYLGYDVPDEETHAATVREKLCSNAAWYIAHGARCHYRQVRPYPLTMDLPSYTDCSGSTSMFYKVSGGPDPNGDDFSGYGYTGTQRSNGKRVPLAEMQPGDLLFYGDREGAQHVTMALGNGRVFSFGSNPPKNLPYDYRPVDMVRSYL